jgi:hypothetical protein
MQFGTRGSEVQILSPRPFFLNESKAVKRILVLLRNRPPCVLESAGSFLRVILLHGKG